MELSADTFTWLISQAARLRAAHGEVIGTPELVEPTGEYFPDAFERDAESVERLLTRLVGCARRARRPASRMAQGAVAPGHR